MSKLPEVEIEYLDAGLITQGDWLSLEECIEEAKPENYINRIRGRLLHEDKVAVVVAAHEALHPTRPMYDCVAFIPKALIRKRKVLKV